MVYLKRQLQSLSQVSQPCTQYLGHAKLLTDQLSAVGKIVDNDDLISDVLGRLHPNYIGFTTSNFATRESVMSFEDFQVELLSHEILIRNQHPQPNNESVNFTIYT